MVPERLPDINLLPQYERQTSYLFPIFIIFISITLIAYIFIGVSYVKTKSSVKKVDKIYAQLNEEVETLQLEVNQINDRDENLGQAVLFAENHVIPISTFIVYLNDILPDKSFLREYTYENQIAEVIAHFEVLDSVASYTTALTVSDYIRDTKVDEIEAFMLTNEESTEDEVLFDTIPRYQTEFTLTINKHTLQEETDGDE